MDPVTIGIIGSIAGSYLANFTTPVLQDFFNKVLIAKPQLEKRLQDAQTPQDFERIFQDAIGVIDASAGQGKIEVDGALLDAIRGIRFDHSHGTVTIQGTTMQADIISTGGSIGSTGNTIIQETEMKSKGTKIEVKGNAQIKLTGGAQIKQT